MGSVSLYITSYMEINKTAYIHNSTILQLHIQVHGACMDLESMLQNPTYINQDRALRSNLVFSSITLHKLHVKHHQTEILKIVYYFEASPQGGKLFKPR